VTSPLCICLDARLRDGVAGGVQQFVMGLASGLSRLHDGDEQYLFLSVPGQRTWLEPHLSGACRALDVRPGHGSRAAALPLALRDLAGRAASWVVHSRFGGLLPVALSNSDGTVERSGADLMHFTVQDGFRTALPTIYQPYDLQHLHLPDFFTPFVRRWRAERYGPLSQAARAVVVMSSWVKEDVVRQLGVEPAKVRVIPWAPVTEEYPKPLESDLAQARRRFSLPEEFAIYPAQTFPHKNHLALLDAIDIARRRGVMVHVVCPGRQNDHHRRIAQHARRLGVQDHVSFVGYVTPLELQCLYCLASFLVFPSLFEGGGMPIFEAWAAKLAVACSDVTCLPKQVGDAAILFDAHDPASIADAMIRLWCDGTLRVELARRGVDRVSRFSWDRTARMYRALYREVAGRPLTIEDRALLEAPADT
jgi:glycosyltransferase involved in cell wall biosynthesis